MFIGSIVIVGTIGEIAFFVFVVIFGTVVYVYTVVFAGEIAFCVCRYYWGNRVCWYCCV